MSAREGAWRGFVYHAEVTDVVRCRARVRTRRTAGCAVLQQCNESVEAGTTRCPWHAGEVLFGEWDPLDGLSGIRRPKIVQWVIAEAKRRAADDRCPLSDGDGGFKVPRQRRRGPGGTAGSGSSPAAGGGCVHQRASAPKFVAHVPGELRSFYADLEVLPPFPCLLCLEADFGSQAALLRHISEEHVSWPEYRKRLLYEACRGPRPVPSQVWRLVMGHATEELCSGSKEWFEDFVDDFEDIDARVNVLRHLNQLVTFKGGLVKFLQCLVRSLQVCGVDSSASVADATAAVCGEDVCVKACFERGERTPYMQATQHAVLHVARKMQADGRVVSEGNALFTVWDTFVSLLEDKGLSPDDDPVDWSQHQVHEADGVCEVEELAVTCIGRNKLDEMVLRYLRAAGISDAQEQSLRATLKSSTLYARAEAREGHDFDRTTALEPCSKRLRGEECGPLHPEQACASSGSTNLNVNDLVSFLALVGVGRVTKVRNDCEVVG